MVISRLTPYVYLPACSTPGLATDADGADLQHQCIKNLTAILEASGSDITKVVKVNVFLSDMDNFAPMNEIYSQYWGDVKPCRT